MPIYEDDLYQYIVSSEEKSTKLARFVSDKDFDLALTFVKNGVEKIPAVKTIRELNSLRLDEATYAYNSAKIAYDQGKEAKVTSKGYKAELTLVDDKVSVVELAPVKKSNHCPNYHRPIVGEKFIWGETQLKHGDVLKDRNGNLHTYNAHKCHEVSLDDYAAWFKDKSGKDINRLVTFSQGQIWPALVGATIHSLAGVKPERHVKVGDKFKNGDTLVPGDALQTKDFGIVEVTSVDVTNPEWVNTKGITGRCLTKWRDDSNGNWALRDATYVKLGK